MSFIWPQTSHFNWGASVCSNKEDKKAVQRLAVRADCFKMRLLMETEKVLLSYFILISFLDAIDLMPDWIMQKTKSKT